jgi:iron complex transport system substrate-binding protein
MAQELEKRTVACIEWIDPLMAAGNWMLELVELAGGINLFGSKGKHSSWMEFEDLIKRDPDVIIVMPCGYNIDNIWIPFN